MQYSVNKESKKLQKKAQTKKAAQVGSKSLFKGFSVHVRVASASLGQSSFSNSKLGGVSAVLMQEALLNECVRGKKASWQHIENNFKEVKELKVSQTPLVSVQVKNVPQHTHEHKHGHKK